MIKVLYNNLALNTIFGLDDLEEDITFGYMTSYINTVEGGYYYIVGNQLGVEAVENIFKKYAYIVGKILTVDGYKTTTDYDSDVLELFYMFVNLTPTQQNSFISSICIMYPMGMPDLVFRIPDPSEESDINNFFTCIFADIINEYFSNKLTNQDAVSAYYSLVLAIEVYSKRMTTEGWLDDFISLMDEAITKSGSLVGDDKVIFEGLLLDAMNKYKAIRARYNKELGTETQTDLEALGWEDEFLELKEAIICVEFANELVNAGYTLYGLYFSAYERAEKLARFIIDNAPPEVVDAYYYEILYNIGDEPLAPEGGTDTGETAASTEWTLDFAMSLYRNVYISLQLDFSGSCIYDVYRDLEMSGLYDKYYDLIWEYLMSPDGTEDVFNKSKVVEFMMAYTDMDIAGQLLFVLFDGELGEGEEAIMPFVMAISAFIEEDFTEGAAGLVNDLIILEQYYLYVFALGEEETYNDLKELLAEVKDVYENLSAEDKASFEALEDYYEAVIKKMDMLVEEMESLPQN